MAYKEDRILWEDYQNYKKEIIQEIYTDFKKDRNVFSISLEGIESHIESEKEDINMSASRDAFIKIMDRIKNYFNGGTINGFIDFMDSNYADKKDREERPKINAGNYNSVEVFLKRYWIRNLKRCLPKADVKNAKEFYAHLNELMKLPDFKTYGQHFWTLHSSHKGRDIYKNIYNLHAQNIVRDFPLITLDKVKIKDVNWIS